MQGLATFGDVVATAARVRPKAIGAADLDRKLTNAEWYARSCRLAHALAGLGLVPGDRFCVLARNRIEWLEMYAAAALAGVVAVPINFRLGPAEVAYIVRDCGVSAMLAEADLCEVIDAVRPDLPAPAENFVVIGAERGPGWVGYETLIARGLERRPEVSVAAKDPQALLYTSGTTGHPKGAIRSHESMAMLSLVTAPEMRLTSRDCAMLVMPMCHVSSDFFMGAFACEPDYSARAQVAQR